MANEKPTLSFWQIWNMCFGFLGLQFAFALQNSNVSRIFQTLGASIEQIPLLWIAGPLTGLLVQPVVGYLSDRTWTRFGRRRPYFLIGAIFATLALIAMPRSPYLWVAAATLWILDAAINVSMEPFRAFVGDQLSPKQRPTGYAMQSFFIGIGAVVASMLPWILTYFGVSNEGSGTAGLDAVPDSVRYSFDIGAVVLLLAIGWTVWRSREYPPEALESFADAEPEVRDPVAATTRRSSSSQGLVWVIAGVLGAFTVRYWALDQQLYIVCGGVVVWGIARLVQGNLRRDGMVGTILNDLEAMPLMMRRLAAVQFFTWLALFAMWIYTTSAVAEVHFGSNDPKSAAYNEGANWVGVLFAAYSGFAAVAAVVIPLLVQRIGMEKTHMFNLWLGALALLSFLVIRDPLWLLAPMVAMGFAWASILSLPYALLASSLPAKKMGVYMGIFNFFIVIPQLVAASVLGLVVKLVFDGHPIYALGVGGVSFVIAGLLVLRLPQRAA
jgi:maltose/moltooligosaccharide transporter